MAIYRVVCQTLKDAPVLLLYGEAGRFFETNRAKSKSKKKLIVPTLRLPTNGWESDTVPESFLSSVALMIAALKAQQPYEMEEKIEKYGTLESSALLYFSKVSSSSACLMEARWNTTSSGFATRPFFTGGLGGDGKEAALGYNHLVPSA